MLRHARTKSNVSVLSEAWSRNPEPVQQQDRRAWVLVHTHPIVTTWVVTLLGLILLSTWNASVALSMSGMAPDADLLGPAFESVFLIFLWVDILMQFNMTYVAVHGEEDVLVRDRKRIMCNYLTGWFLFDALTAFPWSVVTSPPGSTSSLRVVKFLKLAKSLRFVKIMANSDGLKEAFIKCDDILARLSGTPYALERVVVMGRCGKCFATFFAFLLVESHVLALCMFSQGKKASYGSGDADVQLNVGHTYRSTLCWALRSVVTGVAEASGVLNMSDDNDMLFLHGILPMLAGANLMAALVIAGSLSESDQDHDIQMKLRLFKHYLADHSVGRGTRIAVLDSVSVSQRFHSLDSFSRLLKLLPSSTSKKLHYEVYRYMFEGVRVFGQGPFSSSSRSFLRALCVRVQGMVLDRGEHLVTQGLPNVCMYFVMRGFVSIDKCSRQSETSTASIDTQDLTDMSSLRPSANTVFGAQALLAPWRGKYRHADSTVIAGSVVECARLHRDHFNEVLHQRTDMPEWRIFVNFVRAKVSAEELTVNDLCEKGLDDRQLRDWAQIAIESKDYSAAKTDLGVRCQWLQRHFRQEIMKQTNKDDAEIGAMTFNHLRDEFWPADSSKSDAEGFMGSQRDACPRDHGEGCAVVDAQSMKEHTGGATHFVSWCWRYSVSDVVSSLESWLRGSSKNSDAIFLWMCFFCNNQRAILLEGGGGQGVDTTSLEEAFASRLRRIGTVLILLDNYTSPVYTTRIWTVFEVYIASSEGIEMEVALPTTFEEDLGKKLMHREFPEVLHSLTQIDTEHAQASFPEDEKILKDKIRADIGFRQVNMAVKSALSNWLVRSFEAALSKQLLGHHAASESRCAPENSREVLT